MATIGATTAAATASNTTANASVTGLASNFETFMTLLTAQLRAQDPLSPLDTKDFTNQLVQFSGVEQQLKTNQLLSSLTTTLGQNSGAIAVSYLGKEATANTNLSAIENGNASWNYQVPTGAASVNLKIYDSNKKLVSTQSGDNSQGAKTFEWNGNTNTGSRLTSGEFTLEIEALNATGASLTIPITKKGIITNVDMSGEETKVRIGGTDVKLSTISKIALAAN